MHPRQRNGPANGYNSNAMGFGSAPAASLISPEGSIRGHRMYNSEYRNYSRGSYGRGDHSKQFQQTLPPPRATDIFVEAGRLAAEYLVSKGVLPPNALSGKWQSDSLKNVMNNFQGFRAREVDQAQLRGGGPTSIHSRSGNGALLDSNHGGRRYFDQRNSMVGELLIGRTRTGSFKSCGSEVNKELGKNGSRAENNRTSLGKADSDASTGHHDEQHVGLLSRDGDGREQMSLPVEISEGNGNTARLESDLGDCASLEDAGAKASSFKVSNAIEEPAKKSDDANQCILDSPMVEKVTNDNGVEKKNNENKDVTSAATEDSLASDDVPDLVKHSQIVNVPTKPRSSLKAKGSKSNQDLTNENEEISEKVYGLHAMDVTFDTSADASNPAHGEKEPDVTYVDTQRQYLSTGSSPEKIASAEQEPDQRQFEFGSLNSMLMDKGGKRAMDDDTTDGKEDTKKLREWAPTMDSQSSLPNSGSFENQPTSLDPVTSKSADAAISVDPSNSLFPGGQTNSSKSMEEKQLFPGLSKTYDLTFAGNSEVNENHDVASPVSVFPSDPVTHKAAPVDVDLSKSNNSNLHNKNGIDGFNNNDIEIIDLEDESANEDRSTNFSERRRDTLFTDLDGCHNNVHNANEIPDIQDGYGFTMSELLGNDSLNSSSVATEISSFPDHMDLLNGEGILGDDDSIYMSLGEIPMSLLGAWEQPT